MAVRVPLPNRRQLQSLTGLVQAIKYHLNVASNTIITDDSALGYINAAEDIDLIPLKTFFMKRSELITVDNNGQFKLKDLKFPVSEIIGVFYRYQDQFIQDEYLQYVDPQTFGRGYGTVYTNALYTVKTASDGTNDQTLALFPATPSASVGIEYYTDWPKLGDLTTASRLQQFTFQFQGTADSSGTYTLTTTTPTGTVEPTVSFDIPAGYTAANIATAFAAYGNNTIFGNTAGNNYQYWVTLANTASLSTATPQVTFVAPEYLGANATLTLGGLIGSVNITQTQTINPFIQTVETNWFLYNFPYLYYYAALKHAYNGLDDLERYQLVEKEYIKAVQVFQSFTDRAEFAGSMQQSDYNQNVIW